MNSKAPLWVCPYMQPLPEQIHRNSNYQQCDCFQLIIMGDRSDLRFYAVYMAHVGMTWSLNKSVRRFVFLTVWIPNQQELLKKRINMFMFFFVFFLSTCYYSQVLTLTLVGAVWRMWNYLKKKNFWHGSDSADQVVLRHFEGFF